MTLSAVAFLFAAGALGGLTGSIVGFASLPTYPALLMYGLPPVTANITNTVATVANGIGAALGSRPELCGQAAHIRRMAPIAALGGAAGALLLLSTPAAGFEKAVPILLGLASIAIVIPRRWSTRDRRPSHRRDAVLAKLRMVAILLICVYGGYFGAAAGVLLLALLLHGEAAPLARANAAKNVTVGIANGVAAIIFALLTPIQWPAVVALGAGCLVGARIGPIVTRHTPAGPLRVGIGTAGLVLAVVMAIDAYG